MLIGKLFLQVSELRRNCNDYWPRNYPRIWRSRSVATL